ncbi:hypothetical protein LIER_14831 [Lithospermum erythrorhizon]|uniref:Uncharacterized protein n=1 Tax=Lithospermum erythrorhizon TaxID=34254 RepID=A0AAV3Q0J6_LITER
MGDKFTIQISANLVNQLAEDGDRLKKKKKKTKSSLLREPKPSPPKVTQKQTSEDPEIHRTPTAAGWPGQPPLFFPVPPSPPSANEELDAIRAVLQDSEKALERLQKQEDTMLQEVTQKAKDLHDKEFKLPEQKPIPCVEEKDVCLNCYKENLNDPLKCSSLVNEFANCVRRMRQQVGMANK